MDLVTAWALTTTPPLNPLNALKPASVGSVRSVDGPSASRLHQVVAGLLQLQGQLLAPGLHDADAVQDVPLVRDDVVEEALVVRDDDHGAPGVAQPVDALGHGAQ